MKQAIMTSIMLASVIFALAGMVELTIRTYVNWWKFALLICLAITFLIMCGATGVAWMRAL